MFCKKPYLQLDALGIDDDLTVDIEATGDFIVEVHKTAAKALYRRGMCSSMAGDKSGALRDYHLALHYIPDDKTIKETILDLENCSTAQACSGSDRGSDTGVFRRPIDAASAGPAVSRPSYTHKASDTLPESEVHYMTVNGGPCLLRKAYWSQTPTDAKVYIPLNALGLSAAGSQAALSKKSGWEVLFSVNQIKVTHATLGSVMEEELEYNIRFRDCLWMIETSSYNETVHFLVLHICKAEPFEHFPGCEWWDRVFQSDDAIDTLTCSISCDVSQLPEHAQRRAQQEHARMTDLSEGARQKELDFLATAKKSFAAAEERTRQATDTEEKAIQGNPCHEPFLCCLLFLILGCRPASHLDVPERAEMLQTLRKQFPGIDFTAK